MVAVSAKKKGRIRTWWSATPPCIRSWIKFVVLPVVSLLLALTVWGYVTYILRGQWTPDHLVSVLALMLEGASALYGLIFDVLKWICGWGA